MIAERIYEFKRTRGLKMCCGYEDHEFFGKNNTVGGEFLKWQMGQTLTQRK